MLIPIKNTLFLFYIYITFPAFIWHLIHLHITSDSNFMANLGCGKWKLWFWENSPQSYQFGIISVGGTPQKAYFHNIMDFGLIYNDRKSLVWHFISKRIWKRLMFFCTLLPLLRSLQVPPDSLSMMQDHKYNEKWDIKLQKRWSNLHHSNHWQAWRQ